MSSTSLCPTRQDVRRAGATTHVYNFKSDPESLCFGTLWQLKGLHSYTELTGLAALAKLLESRTPVWRTVVVKDQDLSAEASVQPLKEYLSILALVWSREAPKRAPPVCPST